MPAVRFPYTVTLQDGTEIETVATAPDLIRMESRFDVCWSALLSRPLIVDGEAVVVQMPLVDLEGKPVIGDDGKPVTVPDVVLDTSSSRVKLEYVAFLAWAALRRARDERINATFETFRDEQLSDVSPTNEAGDSNDETGDDVEDALPEGVAGSAG